MKAMEWPTKPLRGTAKRKSILSTNYTVAPDTRMLLIHHS